MTNTRRRSAHARSLELDVRAAFGKQRDQLLNLHNKNKHKIRHTTGRLLRFQAAGSRFSPPTAQKDENELMHAVLTGRSWLIHTVQRTRGEIVQEQRTLLAK